MQNFVQLDTDKMSSRSGVDANSNFQVREGSVNLQFEYNIPLKWPTPTVTNPPPYPGSYPPPGFGGDHGYVYLMNNGQPLSNGQYCPILLPGPDQLFTQATMYIWDIQAAFDSSYTNNSSYSQSWAGFQLFSVDTFGNDIEWVIQNANLWDFGAGQPATGTLHGNNYWAQNTVYPYNILPPGQWNHTTNIGRLITSPVFIAGFRASSTNSNTNGNSVIHSLTVTSPMIAWLQSFS